MKNIGIDIVKTKRIKLKPNFYNKVLSENEISILNSINSKKTKKQFIAGRWAVKEAIIKALENPLFMNKYDIGYDKNNKPIILNKDFSNIKISISHEKTYAIGIAIEI